MGIHHRSRGLCVVIAALGVLTSCASSKPQPDLTIGRQASQLAPPMDTLVTTEWLSQHLDDPDLIVLDCTVRIEPVEGGGFRPVSGRASYEAGHIPSAGFADLMGDLSDRASPFRFALPTPEQLGTAMGALGVDDGSRVVLYDGSHSVWAARVWWMLRWIGFDRAALLDGGLEAWTAEGRPLSTEPANRPAQRLTPAPRPELVADTHEVRASLGAHGVCLIDALPPPQYRGEMSMYARPGHIPGALNAPALALLDESGRYRSRDELTDMFACDKGTHVITYCGGGIAASSDAFILTRLGFPDVAVYIGSLQEWTADPTNPMEVGAP